MVQRGASDFPGTGAQYQYRLRSYKNFEKAKSNEAGLTADGAVSCLVVCLRFKAIG